MLAWHYLTEHSSMDEIRVGSRVRCGVYVMGEWKPMHSGIVTRDYGDGTYDVDRMSLHGGRPWIVRESGVRAEPPGVAACEAPSSPKSMQGLADWLRMVAETQAGSAKDEATMLQWAREVDAACGVKEVQR